MLLGQHPHLVFRKSEETVHLSWRDNGVLGEVVQRRLSPELLNRQDASHIDPGEYRQAIRTFKHTSQPVEVAVHGRSLRCELAADGIPFVNYKYEFLACVVSNARQQVH